MTELQELKFVEKAYKQILKMHKPLCKDKDYNWGCIGCQANKFLKDFKEYLEWLKGMYKWGQKYKKRKK